MFWCVVGKMHRQRQWSILHVLVCGRQNAPAKATEPFACFGVRYAKCTTKGNGAFCMFWCVVCKKHWQMQWNILHVLVCGMQNAMAKAVEHFACFGVWWAKCTGKGNGAFCMFWCAVCKMQWQRQWSILHVLVCRTQNAPAKAVEHFACFGVWYAKCTGKGSGAFCMLWCAVSKMHWQRQWSILHVLVCGRQNAPAKAVEHFACFGVWYAKCTGKAVEHFACFGEWYAKCTGKGSGAFCTFWCVVCKMHRQRQWSILHVLVCGMQNAPAKAVEHFACFGVVCKMHRPHNAAFLSIEENI